MSCKPACFRWLLIVGFAAGCGGGGKQAPPPKAEAEAEEKPEVALRGALAETPGLARTAEVTDLSDEELVEQGYLYIGTVACEPGPRAQEAIIAAAGEHGGELVKPYAPVALDILGATDGACAPGDTSAGGETEAADGGEASEDEASEGDASEDEATEGDASEDEASEGDEASGEQDGGCGESKPFPMLGMVWATPGDAPPEVADKWKKQDGVRQLHIAVASQDLEAISELVSAGIDINAQDELGRYALYRAALSDDDEYVAMIVGLGANANPPPMWGRSLLENVVDIELRRYHEGNFATFKYDAHKRTLEVIVGAGTDASPAMARAVQRGFCETAEHLSSLGAEGESCEREAKKAEGKRKKNAIGRSYRAALDESRFDDVKQLLKDGVDIGYSESGTKWEASPLDKAIQDANPATVEFLLKKKVSAEFSDSPESQALLCAAARGGVKYVVQQLLKADLTLSGSLHCAAMSADAKKMIPLFLAARVDVDGVNEAGETPLYYLVKESLAELKKKHEYEGDEPPAEPKDAYVKARGDLDKSLNKIVGILTKKGANPNLAPEGAPTVVEIAEGHGLSKVSTTLKKAAKKKR